MRENTAIATKELTNRSNSTHPVINCRVTLITKIRTNSFQCSDRVINFNLGLKGYSTSDCTKRFIKNLILFYINHSLPVQIRRPIRRTGCRILTISKTHKTLLIFFFPPFPSSGTLLFPPEIRGIDLFYVECLLDRSCRKNPSRTPTYTDVPISSFSSRLPGPQVCPRGRLIFWLTVVGSRRSA